MFVRLSRGLFPTNQFDVMVAHLREAEAVLAPAVRELTGLIDYYAGIDQESGTMIRVSVWDTAEHASSLSTFPPVLENKAIFRALGVDWESPITYDVAWWVQPT